MLSRSSSSSMISEDTKRHILSCLPADSKIIVTATARVYHKPFNGRPENWTYSGLHGTMVFGRNRFAVDADKKLGTGTVKSFDQTFWFRLIDPLKGLVWLHQIPDVFDYSLDKPFFHQFSGKSRMFGFRFEDDTEAAKFLKKVTSNVNVKAVSRKKSEHAPKRLSTAMVSGPAPGTFVHVAHVGFDAKGRIETSDDISPEWTLMLEELQGYGVPKHIAEGDRDFVEGFIAGVKSVENSPSSRHATIPSPVLSSCWEKNTRRQPTI